MTLIPDVIVTRADRRPTIKFLREEFLEPGIQAALLWNGSIAPNEDGIPGGEAAIDYDTPLYGPAPLFNLDQRIPFGGGYGRGGYGEIGASRSPSGGYGGGPYGAGAYGVGASWFTWQFPFTLRDGDYQIAALYADPLGNLQASPGTVLVMRVAAVPRPPSHLTAQVSVGNLVLNWWTSPEFAATA